MQPSPHWARRSLPSRDFENMRNNGMTAGLDGFIPIQGEQRPEPEKDIRKLLKAYNKHIPREFFKHYRVGVGNPRDFEGDTVSDLTNLYNAWRISQYVVDPVHIVEIGGGFGCLAAQLGSVYPNAQFTMVDLPESLELQEYYIGELNGNDRYRYTSDITDVTEQASLVINIRSMMEMTRGQIEGYFDWIHRNAVWFYCANRYKKYENALKGYPFDDRWEIYISQPLMLQPYIHEYLVKRSSDKGFTKQLRTLMA